MLKYYFWGDLESGHVVAFERGLEAGDGYWVGDKIFAAGFVPPRGLVCVTYGKVAWNVTDGCFE